ncbi:hypothetical protein ALNOE001_13420 [Candidatus Methanobinarius endosymbioticus]|uniref:Impact N-terminal domain-containing protein n=1 Tax=Candidatus Methanobinarius endosymbioticus TaxID=2006182 RepID=A0A366MBP5_9EURY|nr:hypothetical protein ALNOE001_13420 [Candidatus Methanobinarius endosymbioticus]
MINMKTIAEPYQVELEIKKSQFICRIFPAKNSKEAKDIISNISKKYKDATHNCYTYIVSDGESYDDDGEPSGTAGKPMLNILKKNELNNIVAIVTRYFGGIKLGAGGLIRAYGKSVIEAINSGNIVEMKNYNIYEISTDYPNIKFIENEIRNYNLNILDKQFETKVYYKIAILDKKNINPFKDKIKNQGRLNFLNNSYLNLN